MNSMMLAQLMKDLQVGFGGTANFVGYVCDSSIPIVNRGVPSGGCGFVFSKLFAVRPSSPPPFRGGRRMGTTEPSVFDFL